MTRDRLWPAVLIGWGVASILLTLVAASSIANLWLPDGDDAMRLLEVRDWLAGQSWWDVSQHRLWGGAFAMHWSRIVDLPLGGIMLALDPIVGQAASTRAALVAVPLLILVVVMALATRLTAMLAGVERARFALLLVAMSPPIVHQMRPMRIDHHGWQVMLALGAVVALLSRPSWRSGTAVGLCLAALVSVSLEGMPMTAAIFGVALLAWAHDPARRTQALAMTGTLIAGVVLLHAATRGPAMFAPACDAIAPAWIAALGLATAVAAATVLLAPAAATRRALVTRVGGIAAAAVAGAVTLRLVAPLCTRGPFATLDPLVYTVWYRNVSEGMPIWEQQLGTAITAYATPLVGLAGMIVARQASAGTARIRWLILLAIAAAAFVFSLLIVRGQATANVLAIPGVAWLLLGWLRGARRIGPVLPRTAATAAALLAATPWLPGLALVPARSQADPTENLPRVAQRGLASCTEGREVSDLRALPAGTVFAPLELSPPLLVATPHRAVASGYHRNTAAIHRVLATFMASPAEAERLVRASGADYVAVCPGENEVAIYKRLAPDGFWARLERGERFDWLQPIALPGSPVLAWRVRHLPREARRQ